MPRSMFLKLGRIALALAACLLLAGCATAPAALGPLSGIQEARTRAEVERQASRDPFPSPGDVGLK